MRECGQWLVVVLRYRAATSQRLDGSAPSCEAFEVMGQHAIAPAASSPCYRRWVGSGLWPLLWPS